MFLRPLLAYRQYCRWVANVSKGFGLSDVNLEIIHAPHGCQRIQTTIGSHFTFVITPNVTQIVESRGWALEFVH